MVVLTGGGGWPVPRAQSARRCEGQRGACPVVGPAPAFALTTQSGERLSLADLRGKVLAVTFIYATCKRHLPDPDREDGRRCSARSAPTSARACASSRSPSSRRSTRPRCSAGLCRHASAPIRRAGAFSPATPAEIDDVVRRYGGVRKAGEARRRRSPLPHLADRSHAACCASSTSATASSRTRCCGDLRALLRE